MSYSISDLLKYIGFGTDSTTTTDGATSGIANEIQPADITIPINGKPITTLPVNISSDSVFNPTINNSAMGISLEHADSDSTATPTTAPKTTETAEEKPTPVQVASNPFATSGSTETKPVTPTAPKDDTATEKTTDTSSSQISTKSGTKIYDALNRFNGIDKKTGKYKFEEADHDKKLEMGENYVNWLLDQKNKGSKNADAQIKQFKMYVERSNDPEERKFLSELVTKLDGSNQVGGAKTVMTIGPKDLQNVGQDTIAKNIQNMKSSAQIGVTEALRDKVNPNAMAIAAGHVSELDAQNQSKAVNIYQNSKLNDDAQKNIDKIIINQYGKFDKTQQVDIHQIMSASKFTDTVKYAASNIFQFDKDNQSQAFKITMDTGNEEAIKAASDNWSKYDESARSQIQDIVDSSDNADAKEALADAQSDVDSTDEDDNTYSASSQDIETSDSPIENLEAQAKASGKDIAELAGNLSAVDQQKILQFYSNDSDVVAAILQKNPSLNVLSQISPAMLADIQKTNDIYGLPILFLNASSQQYMVENAFSSGKQSSIKREFLLPQIKDLYDKLKSQENKKQN